MSIHHNMTITQYDTVQFALSAMLRNTIEHQIINLNLLIPEVSIKELREFFREWRMTVSTRTIPTVVQEMDARWITSYTTRLNDVQYKLDNLRMKIIRVKRDLGRWFQGSRIGSPNCQADLESVFGASRLKALLKQG